MKWFLVFVFMTGEEPYRIEIVAQIDTKKTCFDAAKIFQEETPEANGIKPRGRFTCMRLRGR